jgi:hypothetical protein
MQTAGCPVQMCSSSTLAEEVKILSTHNHEPKMLESIQLRFNVLVQVEDKHQTEILLNRTGVNC